MSKSSPLKGAIQNLKINTPFDLRKQGQVALTPPTPPSPKPQPPQTQATQKKVPQPEVPQNEVPRRKGYFRVRHDVFADSLLRDLSGDAFRLFLWISSLAWRYPDSDGTVRASVGFIERGTGISHATISRAHQQLRTQQLIELIQSDYKRGNLWKVSSLAVHGPENEAPHFEPPKNDHEGPSKRESGSLNLRQEGPQIEGEIRNTLKKESKNSLSSVREEKLLKYFEQLKPARKAESELQAFWELRSEYSEEDLTLCFKHLDARGVPGSGEACHSPMAYLSKAIGSVLSEAKAIEVKQSAIQERNTSRAAFEKKREQEDAFEEEESRRREEEFRVRYPLEEDQQRIVSQHAERFPFFHSNKGVLRKLAIEAGWRKEVADKNEAASQ